MSFKHLIRVKHYLTIYPFLLIPIVINKIITKVSLPFKTDKTEIE